VVTVTPDGESYPEDIRPESNDVVAIRDWSSVGHSVSRDDVYRFRRPPGLSSLRVRRVAAGQMLRDLGVELDPGGPVSIGNAGGGEATPTGDNRSEAVAGGVAAPVKVLDGRWLCILDEKLEMIGSEIPSDLVGSGVVSGDLVLIEAKDRVIVGRRTKSDSFDVEAGLAKSRMDPRPQAPVLDSRVLAVRRDGQGQRYLPVREGALQMSQEDYADWPLSGPRTCRWYSSEVAKLGTDHGPRHSTWRSDWSLQGDDRRVVQHELLSEILHVAATYDCLDLSNLACMELVTRHVQLIEREVRDVALAKQLQHQAKGSASSSLPQEAEWFTGRGRRGGTALVSPELMKYVAERASQESAVQKELRKAIEAAKK